jgi:SPP1 gp7 family putative phage head morphogenesis protein
MSAPLPAVPGTFDEAIAWAKSRGVVLPAEFYGALQEESRGKAFTVSGLAGLTQIQQTLDSLNTALQMGESFESWQERFGPEVDLPGPHLEVVFRNFMQTAYNAGRWAQFERNKAALPYVQFVAIDDGRTTPICRSLNRTIRPVGDAFWRGHSPPCHHSCRSTLRAVSAAQAQRYGGITQEAPTEPVPEGWGHKPTGQDAAAGLVQAIANKSHQLPRAWLSVLASFFVGGWSAIATWIGRVFS